MAQTDKELSREFVNAAKNAQWRPVNEQPQVTRETLKRDLREHLIQKNGSEAVADLTIAHLETQATARMHLEVNLREDVARLEASSARFRAETPVVLAPYASRVAAAERELTAANDALTAARCARDSAFARGLDAQKLEIEKQLRGIDGPLSGRVIGWREDRGTAPEFPPGT